MEAYLKHWEALVCIAMALVLVCLCLRQLIKVGPSEWFYDHDIEKD